MNFQRPFLPLIGLSCVFMAACDKGVEQLPTTETVQAPDTLRVPGTTTLTMGRKGNPSFVILPDSGAEYWVTMTYASDARSALIDSNGTLRIAISDSACRGYGTFHHDKDSIFLQAKSKSPMNFVLQRTASDSIETINVTVGIDGAAMDSYESDDAPNEAKALPPDGVKQSHMLDEWDVDWVKIPVTKGRGYRVGISVDGYSVYKGVTLTLYNDDMVQLAPTLEGQLDSTGTILVGNGGQVVLEPVLQGEYLYAKVVNKGASSRTLYSIFARCDSGRTDFFEPDSTVDQAVAIPANGKEVWRHLGNGDEDWLRFQTKKGKHYTIRLGGRMGRSFIAYLDSSREEGNRGTNDKPVEFVAASDGVAFVELARGYISWEGWEIDTVPYSLTVTEDDNVGDAYEPNDQPSQATLLELDGTPQSHHLGRNERDLFRFAVSEGQMYQIRIGGENQGGTIQLQLAKPGASLSNMFEGSYGTRTLTKAAVITYWATGTGTEYLRIFSDDAEVLSDLNDTRDGSDTGAYTIQIARDSAPTITVNGQPVGVACGPGEQTRWFRFMVDSGMGYRVISNHSVRVHPGSPYADREPMVFIASKSGPVFLEVQSADCGDSILSDPVSVVIDTSNIDEYEPDEDKGWDSLPMLATDGTPQYHSIRAYDVDKVRFLSDSGATYTVQVILTGKDAANRFDGYIQSVTKGQIDPPTGDWSPGSLNIPITGYYTTLTCEKEICTARIVAVGKQYHTVVLGENLMGERSPYLGPYTLSVRKN